jgi:5-methylcytosine-specific restriction endonuclease McrA
VNDGRPPERWCFILDLRADGALPPQVIARRLLPDHRTRAKRGGAALDYGLVDERQLLADNPLCEYCRMPLSFAASLDHRTPIARGGRRSLDNLAVCCSRCNSLKGMFTESEFRELLMLLALLHPAARADLERRLVAGGTRYAFRKIKQGTRR